MNISENETTLICANWKITDFTNVTIAAQMLVTDGDRLVNSIIIPCLSAIGIIGNLVFLVTILRLKESQSGLNTYLCHLAVCDILFLAANTCMFWIVRGFFSSRASRLTVEVDSNWECAAYVLATHIWYFMSIQLTTLITVERYFAICEPLRHRLMVGKTRTVWLLACVWSIGIAATISMIPLYGVLIYYCVLWPQDIEFSDLPNLFPVCTSMSISWDYYGTLMMAVVFIFNVIVNVVLYGKIINTLHQRSSTLAISTSDNTPSQSNGTFQQEAESVRNQVAKTLIASGIIFFITQTPYRLSNLENLLDKSNNGFLDDVQLIRLTVISFGGLYLNSIINPFLYFGSCRYYRNALRELFKCK